MNTHRRVIIDTIDHFFARTPNPTASDRERHRIALLAVDKLAPESQGFSLDGLTIAQVQTAVEEGKVSVQEVLNHERSGGGRKSLIAWLEERA